MATATPVSIKPVRNIIANNTSGSSQGATNPTTGVITTTSSLQSTTLTADAVIEELHDDEAILTEHPVEVGSTITDHMYDLPAKLELTYAWSAGSNQNTTQDASFLKNLYLQFLNIKASKTLCTVNTGKRMYTNMVMRIVSIKEDKDTENSLFVRVSMQQIIFATTQVVPLTSAAQQALPNKTGPTINQGNVSLQPATNFNAGAMP